MFFLNQNGVLVPQQPSPFQLESDLQKLVEANLPVVFKREFLATNFTVGDFRFDTIAYNPQSNSIDLIEYKREECSHLVSQGLAYLATMRENQDVLQSLYPKPLDWDSRVLFVSPEFSDYDKFTAKFKDLPLEFWRVFQSGSVVAFAKAAGLFNLAFEPVVVSEDSLLDGASVNSRLLYGELKKRIVRDDVSVRPFKGYVGFVRNKRFLDVAPQHRDVKCWVYVPRSDLIDPRNRASGFNSLCSLVRLSHADELDYVVSLVNQAYERC